MENVSGGWRCSAGTAILAPAPAHAATYQNVSANWSGYMATGGTYTGVSGTWTVPSVRSSSTYRADAAWVGIGGVSTSDLIQAGTSATTGSGPTTYQAWIEMLPNFAQNVPLNVGSGDSVSVSISEQSSGKWKIAIVNNTSGQSYSTRRQVQIVALVSRVDRGNAERRHRAHCPR